MTVSVEQLAAALQPIISRVRTDVTAVRLPDGTSRWTSDALTPERLHAHLSGGRGRGVCPIKEGESTTRLALFDLDSHKGETDWPGMVAAAERLCEELQLWGLEPIPFRSSGGRGLHIFLLWDEPQDAYSVRVHLADLLSAVDLRPGAGGVAHGQVEVFPKQDAVGLGERGNQFILPLAGRSEPLDLLFGLEPMGREHVLCMDWPVSAPVPVKERPPRADLALLPAPVDLEKIRAALAAIPNEGDDAPDYDTWRNLAFAVHDATNGSEDGYEVFADFSARNPKHDGAFLEKRVWPYIKSGEARVSGVRITKATLFDCALRCGWRDEPSAVGMPDMALEPEQPRVSRVDGAAEPDPLPAFDRDKTGKIKPVVLNLVAALRRPDIIGQRLGYDTFRDEIMLASPDVDDWRPLGDADYVWLRATLEMGQNGFAPIGKELIRDVVLAVAMEHKFDSAITWLESLPDDGGNRCETFLSDHFGTPDTPYTRAVSLYMWTAMAGRVLEPGCKADMVPILVGDQGIGKSTVISALVPSVDFFVEVSFAEKDDDLSRKMRGKLVAEIGELRGLHTKELEAIKAFITRTHEQWIPKFREFSTLFPRRLLFIGSTNKDQFLADETGNRRWLPVRVSRVDVDRVRSVAPLLWAEARRLFRVSGVQWQAAEQLGREVHEEFAFEDSWEFSVRRWLGGYDALSDEQGEPLQMVTTRRALVEAVGREQGGISRGDEMRMSAIFRKFGLTRQRVRLDGHLTWVYVPT